MSKTPPPRPATYAYKRFLLATTGLSQLPLVLMRKTYADGSTSQGWEYV